MRFFCAKGLVDVDREIQKLEAKKEKVSAKLQKLNEAISARDYLTKVPENVRQGNDEKVRSTSFILFS